MAKHKAKAIGWIISISILLVFVVGGFIGIYLLGGDENPGFPKWTPFGSQSFFNGEMQSNAGLDKSSTTQAVGIDIGGACTPASGYNKCTKYTKTEESGGQAIARAYVEIHNQDPPVGVKKGDYYVGEVYIPYKFVGDKFYYTMNAPSWNSIWGGCNENGCAGTELSQEGKLTLAKPGEQFTGCPAFYVLDYDRKDGSDGSWAWLYKSIGWGYVGSSCFDIKSVGCYEDLDCAASGSNMICDKTGEWQSWACEVKPMNSYYRYAEVENTCTLTQLYPEQKTAQDYEKQADCQVLVDAKNAEIAKMDLYKQIGIGAGVVAIVGFIIFIVYAARRKKK